MMGHESGAEHSFGGAASLPVLQTRNEFVIIRRSRGLGSYGRQTVGGCLGKPRSGERSYGATWLRVWRPRKGYSSE